MNSKNLRGLREAYSGVYASPELTEAQVWEEVETWVSSLIEEGYDLSDYTWEEMFEEYLNEAGKWVDVPGKGRRFVTSSGEVRMGDPNAPLAGAARAVKQFLTKPRLTPTQMRASTSGAPAPQAGATSRPTAATSTPKPATSAKPTTPLARPPAPILPPSSASRPVASPAPARPAPTASRPAPTAAPAKPSGGQTGDKAKDMATWASANKGLASASAEKARTRGTAQTDNPLMRDMKSRMPAAQLAKPANPQALSSGEVKSRFARASAGTSTGSGSINNTKSSGKMNQNASFEWGATSKLVDGIANAYSSIYEAKKVDQDKDGDNDFADVRIARLIASGVSKEEAIRRVKDKSYNEEVDFVNEKYMGFKALKASIAAKGGVRDPGAVAASIGHKKYGKEKFQKAAATDHKLGEDFELWVNELVEEGYDLSDYTWDEMAEIYEETAKEKEERIAARRARLKEIEAQGRVMTSSKRTSQTAAQRRAEKKAEALERAAEAILNQTRGPGRVSNKPMGSQAPAAKEAPPEANRRLKTGLKRDTLGTAADDALKSR